MCALAGRQGDKKGERVDNTDFYGEIKSIVQPLSQNPIPIPILQISPSSLFTIKTEEKKGEIPITTFFSSFCWNLEPPQKYYEKKREFLFEVAAVSLSARSKRKDGRN